MCRFNTFKSSNARPGCAKFLISWDIQKKSLKNLKKVSWFYSSFFLRSFPQQPLTHKQLFIRSTITLCQFSCYTEISFSVGILIVLKPYSFSDTGNQCEYIVFQKQPSGGALQKRCSQKFRKIHRKIPVPETLLCFMKMYYDDVNVSKKYTV